MYTDHKQQLQVNIDGLRLYTEDIIAQAQFLLNNGFDHSSPIRDIIYDFLATCDISLASVFTVLCARASGANRIQALNVASAVLYIQTASRMHEMLDEPLQDGSGSDTRGFEKLVILSGDLLMAESTRIIASYGTAEAMAILGTGLVHLLEDSSLSITASTDCTDSIYVDRFFKKARSGQVKFVGEAAVVGAISSGVDVSASNQWRIFAESFATAYFLQQQAHEMEVLVQNGFTESFELGSIIMPLVHVLGSHNRTEANTIVAELMHGNVSSVFDVVSRYRVIDRTLELAEKYLCDSYQYLEYMDVLDPTPFNLLFTINE